MGWIAMRRSDAQRGRAQQAKQRRGDQGQNMHDHPQIGVPNRSSQPRPHCHAPSLLPGPVGRGPVASASPAGSAQEHNRVSGVIAA